MTYSASRLTLYALLSGIETDLREMLVIHCGAEKDLTKLLGKDLFDRVFERYVKDGGDLGGVSSITDLVDYLDFADSYQVLNANRNLLPTKLGQMLQEVTPSLQKLIPIRNRVAHSRPLNFEDFDAVLDASEEFQTRSPADWKNLAYTQGRIRKNPGFVLDQTMPSAPQERTTHNLPIPDFDETGFLGRAAQVDQLVKLIFGPYPVISLIGEGGLGKTALALKVAYELLDHPDSSFDAIVWTTAKSATITAHEIVRIEKAITDSLGMLHSVAEALTGVPPTDPIEEIIEYLTEFKLLLILDNLETVIDKRIVNFLERLPVGSKVLITSRIGLGEFERRLKLEPLDSKEAVNLLRSLIRLRGIESLKSASPEHLRGLCSRMQNNPGYIKWFVSAVQAGTRPEEILDQPKLFLDFCLANVYEYLSEYSKLTVKAMQSVAGNLSQAEIGVLTEIDILDLQRALHQLLSTNMIVMKSVGVGSHSETKYGLSELAREYLQRHHAVKPHEYRIFQARQKQIATARIQLDAEQSRNPFSVFSIVAKSKGDVIVAKYLLDALRYVQKHNFKDAQRLVGLARSLAPNNFEVHRVEAWVNASSGNIPAAEECYEVAVELEPNSAPLRMLYGGFLMRYSHDNERALVQYQEAMRLAPNESHVKIETARLFIFMGRYQEAEKLIDEIAGKGSVPIWLSRKTYDIRLQIFQRQADGALHEHDPKKATDFLEGLVKAYGRMSPELRDRHIANTLQRALGAIKRCIKAGGDDMSRERCGMIEGALSKALVSLGFPDSVEFAGEALIGEIYRVIPGKDFAFLKTEEGAEYYMHFGQVRNFDNHRPPAVGDKIAFHVGQNHLGPCAMNCMIQTDE